MMQHDKRRKNCPSAVYDVEDKPHNMLEPPSILGQGNVIRAVDGLQFATRDAQLVTCYL